MAAFAILGISGSLRRSSFNTAALRAARDIAPAHVTIDIFPLADVPPFDDDIRARGYPHAVDRLREAITAADALLIATPEYNHSLSGVLKNAIDWASRPPAQPFDGKPVAILGVSSGLIGTARAQYDLRKILGALNAHVLNGPEVLIGQAQQKFDAQGMLTDEATRGFLKRQLEGLEKWALRLRN
jgi:chromate reductase